MWEITGREMETSGRQHRRTKGSEEGGRAENKWEMRCELGRTKEKETLHIVSPGIRLAEG